MKPLTSSRRALWLVALPLLALPTLVRAQDEAPAEAPIEAPVEVPEGVDPTAPVDPAPPADATAGAPIPEPRAIDTLDFAAYEKSLAGAPQIELSLTNASVAQIAQEIARQIGQRVEVSPQWEAYPDSKLSLNIARAPLWSALGQLKASGVDAQWIAATRTLQLLPLADASEAKVPPVNPLSQPIGAAVLNVSRIQRTRALLFPSTNAGGDKQDRFEIELGLRPDPRWRAIDGTASWAGLSLVDAKGTAHPVLAEAVGGTLDGAQAAFDATRIDTSGPATLRGEMRFAVVSKSQAWNLDDLTKPASVSIERDGVPVRYEYLGTNNSNNSLSLRFAASNAPGAPGTVIALPSSDPNLPASNLPIYHFAGVNSGLRILNTSGAPIEFMEAGSGLQSNERSEFEVQTIPDLATGQPIVPARAQLEVPLEWREVRVPFEIKNVPLP